MLTFMMTFSYTAEGLQEIANSSECINDLKQLLHNKFQIVITQVFMLANNDDTLFLLSAPAASYVKAAQLYMEKAGKVMVINWNQVFSEEELHQITTLANSA